MQHAVQRKEGFARGGSPESVAEFLPDPQAVNDARVMEAIMRRNNIPSEEAPQAFLNLTGKDSHPLARHLLGQDLLTPNEAYTNLAGEVESRLVQKRMNMTPEELQANPPWSMYDVPEERQIVNFDDFGKVNRYEDYVGHHKAPGPDFGARLDDLTGGGQMYPEDVYSPNAVRYYGTGDTKLDKESFAIAQRMRNKPDEMVDIYRAVPNETDISSINAGDWVTINPNYAKQHGESNLPEGYKILSQKVPAKSVWTNADSIHEYGYWPE